MEAKCNGGEAGYKKLTWIEGWRWNEWVDMDWSLEEDWKSWHELKGFKLTDRLKENKWTERIDMAYKG